MMHFKIHDGSPHEDGVIYLALIEAEPDHIMLCAVDQEGKCLLDPNAWSYAGALLTLTGEGYISLSPNVMPALGFDLDVDQRLKLDPFSESKTAERAQRYGGKRAAFRAIDGNDRIR